jgi:hypothetical protein
MKLTARLMQVSVALALQGRMASTYEMLASGRNDAGQDLRRIQKVQYSTQYSTLQSYHSDGYSYPLRCCSGSTGGGAWQASTSGSNTVSKVVVNFSGGWATTSTLQ